MRLSESKRTEIKLCLETRASVEKRRFHEADDTVTGEEVGQGMCAKGGGSKWAP